MVAANNETVNIGVSVQRDALWRAIVETLGDFSAVQRKVFVLYHYTGSSIPSIAQRTGYSENRILAIIDQTNRVLMHKLQRFRGEHGGILEADIAKARMAAC